MRPTENTPPPPAPRAVADFAIRHSHIIALALFAVVGLLILDDYGISADERWQRNIGYASFNYILGDPDALLADDDHNRFYGVGVELPLIAIERALGLDDSRPIYLTRHLLTHALFLIGGFFAWLLAYRLFGSRPIALLAMLIFLLHPRLYANSFFNTKDLPFLCAFMAALYLIHRAFRRDSVWAFALCGAGVAALVNIRVIGVMLFAAVAGMLALDALRAHLRGAGARRVLANAAAFALAAALAIYVAFPFFWDNPLKLIDAFPTLARHPNHIATLFRGAWVQWPNIPWSFIPAWTLVTTPPIALALAALGTLGVARLCAARRRDMFANSAARFGLLIVACLTLPVIAAIALNANLYDDWRQMYFLWAPICVLASFGLRALTMIPHPRLRLGALALTTVGIAAAAAQMVSLHPHQNDYFNPLASKATLAERWEMNYWHAAARDALEALLETRPPDERIIVLSKIWVTLNLLILPEEDRRRFVRALSFPDFSVVIGDGGESAVWKREVYGVPIISILDERAESEALYRAAYTRARQSSPAAASGGFSIYADGDNLLYIKESCADADAQGTFALRAIPPASDNPANRAGEWTRFNFHRYGARFDGKCLISAPLPDYEIESVETAQWADAAAQTPLWSAAFSIAKPPSVYADALSTLPAAPSATAGGFDIYADADRRLIYLKSPCAARDVRGRFGLTVFPANPSDLSQRQRAAGLETESFEFPFHRYGAALDGKCVIIRLLPDYPISHIETWRTADGETIPSWSAEIRLAPYYDRFRRAIASLPAQPSAQSGFDLYLSPDARTLTYLKSPCAEDDARGRFFLSIFPANPSDLEEESRAQNRLHNPLNFDFHRYGAIFDGVCAIIRPLPPYPATAVETGQWTTAEGQLWKARVETGN